ncbi:MAG: PIN domain-containing protein [Gaiellaceae bacterium MAG52_C11]|nr:PIN domain-containing protein [Candidatus Gaiellasilicea maunaloa]
MSAFIADGPPSRLVELAVTRRISLILPEPVLVELERVLVRKLGFSGERWLETRALLESIAAERPAAPVSIDRTTGDPADDVILGCAVAAAADVLASGDRQHLLPVGAYGGVRILTPQALLAELSRAQP